MFLRITNIGGLFLLCCLAANMDRWALSINKTNILSPYIINFIHFIPPVLIYLLIVFSFLWYIISIVSNIGIYPLYLLSVILFHVLIKISLNTLILEDTTIFVFFEVHHHIPIEWKITFFENSLLNNIAAYKPEILVNQIELKNFMKINLDVTKIQDLNALQIAEYANQIFNQQLINQKGKVSSYIQVISSLSTCSGFLYIFSTACKTIINDIFSKFY